MKRTCATGCFRNTKTTLERAHGCNCQRRRYSLTLEACQKKSEETFCKNSGNSKATSLNIMPTLLTIFLKLVLLGPHTGDSDFAEASLVDGIIKSTAQFVSRNMKSSRQTMKPLLTLVWDCTYIIQHAAKS